MRLHVLAQCAPILVAAASSLSAQDGFRSRPIVFEHPLARVVLVDPVGAPAAADDRLMERLIEGCRRRTPLDAADSVRIVRSTLPRDAEPTAPDAWTIRIIATPLNAGRFDCGVGDLPRAIAPARGISFAEDSASATTRHPLRVAIVRRDALLGGQHLSLGPSLRLTPDGVLTNPEGSARSVLDLAALAPDASGLPRDLALSVGLAETGVVVSTPIPPALIREIWDRAMPGRFQRALSRATPTSHPQTALPVPRDPMLVEAHRLHVAGEHFKSVEVALARFQRTGESPLHRDDILTTRLQLGLTALAMGDTSAAIVNFEHAKLAEPCVRFAESVPQEARLLLDRLPHRPRDCRLSPLPAVGLRGLLLPGFGHRRAERPRIVTIAALAALSGVVATSVWQQRKSAEQYGQYLAELPSTGDHEAGAVEAREAYDRAESTRLSSVRFAQVAAALWALSAVDAVMGERWFRARLATVRNVGGVGVSVRVQ